MARWRRSRSSRPGLIAITLTVLLAGSVLASTSSGAAAPGSVDLTFNSPRTGANGAVTTVAALSDGSYIIGGAFSKYNSVKSIRLAHLNSDGTPDADFASNLGTGFNATVTSVAVQPDGKILVGGIFTKIGNTKACGLTRLNPDGTLDTDFNSATLPEGVSPGATKADGKTCSWVTAVAMQGEKPLVAGIFRSWNGNPRSGLLRLNTDGSFDDTFDPAVPLPGIRVTTTAGSRSAILSTASQLQPNSMYRITSTTIPGSLKATFSTGTGRTQSVRVTLSAPAVRSGTSVSATLSATGIGGASGTPAVNAIAVDQGSGEIWIGGSFVNYDNVTRNNVAKLTVDGQLDAGFNPGVGPDAAVNAIGLARDTANVRKLYIGGSFGKVGSAVRNRIARLSTNGLLDTGFDPATGLSLLKTPGFDGYVTSLVPEPDGTVHVGGTFAGYGGSGSAFLTQVRVDGRLSSDFRMSPARAVGNAVSSIAVDGDGNLIVGGWFERGVSRLDPTGSLDRDPSAGTGFNYDLMTAANGGVNVVDVNRDDGTILIGGNFTSYNMEAHSHFARLNPEGTLDSSCDPGLIDGEVNAIKRLSTDEILIGGSFKEVDGKPASGIALLNPDCSFSSGLGSGATWSSGSNKPSVNSISVDGDGRIVVGGSFNTFMGRSYGNIARINSDYTLDTTLLGGSQFDAPVWTVAVQSDGKILAGGDFTHFIWLGPGSVPHDQKVGRIMRLKDDGHLDSLNVGSGANGQVHAIAIQPDGRIVVGGYFNFFNGQPRNRIVRLTRPGTLEGAFDTGGPITDSPPSMTATTGSYTAVLSDTSMLAPNTTYGVYTTDEPTAIPSKAHATLTTGGLVDDGGGNMIVDPKVTLSVKPVVNLTADGDTPNGGIALVQRGAGGGGVRQLLIQGTTLNAKILAVGSFKNYDGQARGQIAALKYDGSLDTSFKPGFGFNGLRVNAVGAQGSNVVVGGEFTSYNGIGSNRVIRLVR